MPTEEGGEGGCGEGDAGAGRGGDDGAETLEILRQRFVRAEARIGMGRHAAGDEIVEAPGNRGLEVPGRFAG